MSKFEFGQVVMTKNVAEKSKTDMGFEHFLQMSLSRYLNCDWGDTCKEDWDQNDISVEQGERILAVYYNPSNEDETIWIITEWDRSVTTILFPSEY